MYRLLSVFGGLVGLTTASHAHSTPSTTNPKQVSLAPLLEPPTGSHHIKNAYIIVFKKDISPTAFDAHMNFIQNELQHAQVDDGLQEIGQRLDDVYTDVIKGYAGTFAPSTINKIRARPEVNYVEVDQFMLPINYIKN